jgi:hypothetical protein
LRIERVWIQVEVKVEVEGDKKTEVPVKVQTKKTEPHLSSQCKRAN